MIINQGVHDESDDKKFDVIKEKGVFGKISEIKMHESFPSTLVITIDILDEAYKGRKIWDNITFDPKSDYAWKYRALRKCVGMPYTAAEGLKIDIDKILLNKKVKMNLDGRMGTDGNEYQKITYIAKKLDDVVPAKPLPVEPVYDNTILDDDEPSSIETESEW